VQIYQCDPSPEPDSEFEPGGMHFLVEGNRGRMLDARRTPVRIVELRPERAMFVLRIEGFEDRGALWELSLEQVCHYQFTRDARRAWAEDVERMQRVLRQLDLPLTIECDEARARATRKALAEQVAECDGWLNEHGTFLAADGRLPDPRTRTGDPRLYADLQNYMRQHGLADIEAEFARQYVSNPHAGETIKAHRIVVAELGLAAYHGRTLRNRELLDAGDRRTRCKSHIIRRLAFARAFFGRLGVSRVTLYRGMSTTEKIRPDAPETFVSATFSRDVADSHFRAYGDQSEGVMCRAQIPVERMFMTYLETEQMNRPFQEAEAVLLHDPETGSI
jgi:hypothetical protein